MSTYLIQKCLIVLTFVVTVYSGTCHFPTKYQISNSDYIYIIREHPVYKYRPFLKFGVVYNDYHVFSSLYRYARANIDGWRSKSVGEIVGIFEDDYESNTAYISVCSCTTPIADGRYCCSSGECGVGCLSCEGSCIGSADYHSGYICDNNDLVKHVANFYSKLNNDTDVSLHRKGILDVENSILPNITASRSIRSSGPKLPNTSKPPTRQQPPRKCKKDICYNEDSSGSESDGWTQPFDQCKINDKKVVDRSEYAGCKQWCTPKICDCVTNRQYIDGGKYREYVDNYHCVSV